jgi:hypothetical protein
MYKNNYKHYFNNLQNFCLEIHLYENLIFGQKDMQSLSQLTSLVHCILFAP